LKYTRTRVTARIEITGESTKDSLIYSIKDNGVGFNMQFYNKLFGVFQRLHDRNSYEGTRIGLALVQRIVTLHGGQVWADAEVDKGATFYFTIPKERKRKLGEMLVEDGLISFGDLEKALKKQEKET